MNNLRKITSAPSIAQGPKVPRAYTRAKDGRDEAGTRSMQREDGSVSGDHPILSEAAKARIERAGMLIAAGAVVTAIVVGLSHNPMSSESKSGQTQAEVDAENKETTTTTETPGPYEPGYNPSGIQTSGNESE